MAPQAGLSGFARNGLVAVYRDGVVRACEEGRARRVRNIGLDDAGWPSASLQLLAGDLPLSSFEWRTGEAPIHRKFNGGTLIDHHLAHARTSFLTSGFARAAVLVCDSDADGPESLWLAENRQLTRLPLPEDFSKGIAARLSQEARGLGWANLKQLETEARQKGQGQAQELLDRTVDAVLTLASFLKDRCAGAPLCVAGGLFLNGYLNFRLRDAGLFPDVYVPPDPSNSGLGVGCVLPDGSAPFRPGPFIGPSFEDEDVKRILDNCKLTYRYLSESEQLDTTTSHLRRGRLVGWCRNALEWGPRTLGNRSILANPFTPYVSQNLNVFLKHRPLNETYSLAVLAEDMPRLFQRHVESPYMEAEAEIIEGDTSLSGVTGTARRIRVQTVRRGDPLHGLLTRFKADAGSGALVNTSFNGFHEPVVVTPRDAVRVFYGSGLDAVAIGSFWMEK